MRRNNFKECLLAGTICAGSLFIAAPAMAQVDPETPGAATTVTEGDVAIVVTGSRIPRPDLTSSSPVAVATAADISTSGNTANVERFLNELPQFVPATTGASNNPGNGLANIDLRGAGPTRTLVLLDGKRYIPSSLTSVVDLNNIPTPLVSRVEVVTGGASAVYGSDAMTGVVNFILKKDFSGVQADSSYRITERGDSAIFTTAVTAGVNFDDDRGNAAVLVSYTDRNGSFAADRAYSRVALGDSVPNAAGTAGGCIPGTLNEFNLGQRAPAGAGQARVPCFLAGGSTLVPQGIFSGIGATGTIFNPDGTPRAFVDPDDLYNFAPANYLQLPQERWLGFGMAEYEISPALVPYVRAAFAWNNVPRQLAPTPISNVFSFNLNNPYLQPAARTLLCNTIDMDTATSGTQTPTVAQCAQFQTDGRVVDATFGRRMIEVGPRQNPQDSLSFQAQVGLRGDLGSSWNYDAYYQYARTQLDVRLLNDVSRERFQNALFAVRDSSGNIVCRDAAARSAGCIPINVFGLGNVTEAAANYVRLSAQSQTFVKQEVAGASVSGHLPFNLAHEEPVGLAIGVEYRAMAGAFEPDEALQRQVLGFNRAGPTRGKFNVKEAFAELNVPILGGMDFVHDLRLTGAVRTSDYSSIGSVLTYSGGAEFAPTRDIRFRAQYQRATRAPSIGELFAGQGNNFPAATDPCSSRAPVSEQTAAIRAACVRSGIPADRVFLFPANTQTETLLGGNPNLFEETSDTYTVGAVITPTFFPGFNATIDYFHIAIDDAIATFGGGTANVMRTCYGPQVGGDPTNIFCQAISRRADSTINIVTTLNENISQLVREGIDFGLDYRRTLPFGFWDDQTSFSFVMRGTRTLTSSTRADPTAAIVDCVGLYGAACGNPIPKWRLNNSLSLKSGPVGFTLQHRWFSKTFDARQQVFANPDAVPPVTPSFALIDRPSSIIGNYHVFDASVNFDVNEHFNFTVGVENLLDRQPPAIGVGEQNNTYPSLFDPFGRSFVVSGQLRF